MFINAKILALSSVFSIAIFMIVSCVDVASPILPTASTVPAKNSFLAELGNTKVSPKDNATMVYVPAGQFPMGSEFGLMDEKPAHPVLLDAFWLDHTEVTNEMYRRCVQAKKCDEPSDLLYYDDPQFSNHSSLFHGQTRSHTVPPWIVVFQPKQNGKKPRLGIRFEMKNLSTHGETNTIARRAILTMNYNSMPH